MPQKWPTSSSNGSGPSARSPAATPCSSSSRASRRSTPSPRRAAGRRRRNRARSRAPPVPARSGVRPAPRKPRTSGPALGTAPRRRRSGRLLSRLQRARSPWSDGRAEGRPARTSSPERAPWASSSPWLHSDKPARTTRAGRPQGAEKSADPAEPLDRAAQLVGVHSRVALRRVEVLVAEQLLDLAQVRPGVQQLGGEDVAERLRRHPLALVDAGRVDVMAERLAELGVVEPVALHADEDRPLGQRHAGRVVLGEERGERGVDRDRALPAALRLAHPQQPPREVDVVPVEAEQFASSESRIRHQGEQEPVALRLSIEAALPELVASGLDEQPFELAHRQHVRERLPLLRRSQRQGRIADESLLLDEETEEALERRRAPRLARDRRSPLLLLGEEG